MFLRPGEGLALAAFAYRSLPPRIQPATLREVRDPAALTDEGTDPVREALLTYLHQPASLGGDAAAMRARINDFVGVAVFEGERLYEEAMTRDAWPDDKYAFLAAQIISLLAGNNYPPVPPG